MSDANNSAAFDDILDGTLDGIKDLPSFAAWIPGAYRVRLPNGFVQKFINDKPTFELKMVNLEVLELANAADEADAPKIDDECSLNFQLDNDIGKGFFKEAIKPFVEHLGLKEDQPGAIRAAVDASKGMEVMVVMKRTSKKGEDGEVKYFPKLASLAIL